MKITSEITLKGVDKKDSHEDLIDRVVEKCFEIENLDSDKVYVAITLTTPENIREINDCEELLNDLESLRSEFKRMELPKSREEFESRA